jgi:DNA-binding transcriptional MerR regulator
MLRHFFGDGLSLALDNTGHVVCNQIMTSQLASRVIAIPAAEAHVIAQISYRQLDHWARQAWVRPTVDAGLGRAGRRVYSADDVVRLHLLRHLALAKVNMALAGPAVGGLEIPPGEEVILWGPLERGDVQPGLLVLARDEAWDVLAQGGAWIAYDPAPARQRIAVALDGPQDAQLQRAGRQDSAGRRTA